MTIRNRCNLFVSIVLILLVSVSPLMAGIQGGSLNDAKWSISDYSDMTNYVRELDATKSRFDDMSLFVKKLDLAEGDVLRIYAWNYLTDDWKQVRNYEGITRMNVSTGWLGSDSISVRLIPNGDRQTGSGVKLTRWFGYNQTNPPKSFPQAVFPQLWFQWFRIGPNDYDSGGDDQRIFNLDLSVPSKNQSDQNTHFRFPKSGSYHVNPGNKSKEADSPIHKYEKSTYVSAVASGTGASPNGNQYPAWRYANNVRENKKNALTSMPSNWELDLKLRQNEAGETDCYFCDGPDELSSIKAKISLDEDRTGWYFLADEKLDGTVTCGKDSRQDCADDGDLAVFYKWHDVTPPPPVNPRQEHITGVDGWTSNPTVFWQSVSDLSGVKGYEFNTTADSNLLTGWRGINEDRTELRLPDGRYEFYLRAVDNADVLSNSTVSGNAVLGNSLAVKVDTLDPDTAGTVHSASLIEDEWANQRDAWFGWKPATDKTSGVRGYSYELTHENQDMSGTDPTLSPDTNFVRVSGRMKHEGRWYFNLRTFDKAGNTTKQKVGPFRIDRTSPETTLSDVSGTNIKLNASDTGSGVKGIYYRTSDEFTAGENFYPAQYRWDTITENSEKYLHDVENDGVRVNLPFAFKFGRDSHESVYIDSNGYVSFGFSESVYRDRPLPRQQFDGILAPLWDNLNPKNGGAVYTTTLTDPERFAVTWLKIPHANLSGKNMGSTFQVVLFADGRIRFNYKKLGPVGFYRSGNFYGATVGFDAPRDDSYQLISTGPLNFGEGTSFVYNKYRPHTENTNGLSSSRGTMEFYSVDRAMNVEKVQSESFQ